MKLFKSLLASAAMVLSLNTAVAHQHGSHDLPKEVRFAVTDVDGLEQLVKEFEPFRVKLEEVMGTKFKFVPLPNRVTAITALENGQVDLLFAGGSEYLSLKKAEPKMETIVAVTRPDYTVVFLSHVGSGIKTKEDLKGKTIAMKDIGSTSGHIMPSKLLLDNGFNLKKDFNVVMLGKASVEAFVAEQADVLATTVLKYNQLIKEGEKLNIILKGEPLPNDLFVAAPTISKAGIAFFKKKVLENNAALMKAMLASGENDKFAESKFVEANDSDYDELREAFTALDIDFD